MKKIFTLGFISFVLALSAASGVMALRSENKAAPAEASANNNYSLGTASFFERDSDPSAGAYYTSSDIANNQSTISGLSTSESGTGDSTSVQLRETSLNKKWHAIYQPFSYSISVAAHTKIVLTFTYNYSTAKSTSGGEADHVCEFFYYADKTPTYLQIQIGKDNSAQSSTASTGASSCINERVYSSAATTVSSGNKNFSFTADNASNNAAKTFTLNFALFGYIEQSKYEHQWTGSLSLSASRSTETYVCSATNGSNTTYHTSFSGAVGAAGDGGTVNLFSNCTQDTSGYALTKSLSVVLNGQTLTCTGGGASIFNTANGKTLSISDGTIQSSKFQMMVNVVSGATLRLTSVTLRNTDNSAGDRGYGVVVPGGTVSIYNSTIYAPYNYAILMRNGASVSFDGSSQITASSGASIRAQIDNGSSSVNTIYIGGTSSFNNPISCDLLSRMVIRPYSSNSTAYSGTGTVHFSFDTTPSANDIFLRKPNFPNSIDYDKFVIDGLPGYMRTKPSTVDAAYVIIVDYRTITVSSTLSTHLSVSGSTSFSANSDKTLTLVTSNAKYYALPSSITLKRGTTTLASGSAYTYNSSTGVIVIRQNYMTSDSFTLIANEVVTDAGYVYAFVSSCMHMSDYDMQHNNVAGKGWCSDEEHHYYITAKEGFSALTSAQKEIFKTDSDFEEAHARYLAWAAANGDTQPYVGSTIVSRTSDSITEENDNPSLIIMIAVGASSLLCLGLIILKKKHSN